MKTLFKFSFIALLGLISFRSQAQTDLFGKGAVLPLAAGDTIVNTGTVTKNLNVSGSTFASAGYQGAFIQMDFVKISGTGAGTAQLQISGDLGVTWVNSGSAYTITNTFPQAAQWTLTGPLPPYARILCTGSGTESVQTTTWLTLRKTSTTPIY